MKSAIAYLLGSTITSETQIGCQVIEMTLS